MRGVAVVWGTRGRSALDLIPHSTTLTWEYVHRHVMAVWFLCHAIITSSFPQRSSFSYVQRLVSIYFVTMEDTSEYDQLPFSLWDTSTFPVSVHILFLYLVLYLDLWMHPTTPIVKRTLLSWGLLVALAGNITNRGVSWKKCGWCLHWLYACFYPNAPYISIL